MNNILSNKIISKEETENVNQIFETSAAQTRETEKTKFMNDFENGDTIEQSRDFVLQHINKIWKK